MDLLPLSLCLLTLSGSTSAAGNGPEIIRVKEGRNVTLPCKINKDIRSERFEWKKDGQKDVFLYETTPVLTDVDPQFTDRVSHSDAELKNGDASITIRETKVADSGVYTCNFPNLHQTFTINLVVGPEIIKVEEGRDATLPCNINKDIRSEWFDWMKDGQKEVFLYQGTVVINVDPQFRGRVSHSDAELMKGDASITIRETKVVDSGVYTCEFTNLTQTFTVYLVVGASPKPSFSIVKQTQHWALLQCEVQGPSPKLSLLWKDNSGNVLKASEPQVTERGGRYDVTLQVNVTKTDFYHCVATRDEINHQISSKTHVYIAGGQGASTSSTSIVALCLALTVALR